MYLVDTNIWLESLLDQERASEVSQFLSLVKSTELCLTDFAVHSIGISLFRLGKPELWPSFLQDLFIEGGAHLLHLEAEDGPQIAAVARQHGLDFDDAYQYAAAERYDLVLVSFDSHFDGTPRGRSTPAAVCGGASTAP